MSEFSLIERFCRTSSGRGLGAHHPTTVLGLGDDAAVISIPSGQQLVTSVDTLVSGVHFQPDVPANKLAHKLCAVNVSDLNAMGATPKWATLALTLPQVNEQWMSRFSSGLDAAAQYYSLELVGGDTTQGPMSLTLQILGLVENNRYLSRGGARPGDVLYVTGTLGDAALALSLQQASRQLSDALLATLEQPQPPFEFGPQITHLASSAIDLSDGLIADLEHICRSSRVSMIVDLKTLPISDEFRKGGGETDLALNGGDDYQLAFTLPVTSQVAVNEVAQRLGVSITAIGRVVDKADNWVTVRQPDGAVYQARKTGYQHFAG